MEGTGRAAGAASRAQEDGHDLFLAQLHDLRERGDLEGMSEERPHVLVRNEERHKIIRRFGSTIGPVENGIFSDSFLLFGKLGYFTRISLCGVVKLSQGINADINLERLKGSG